MSSPEWIAVRAGVLARARDNGQWPFIVRMARELHVPFENVIDYVAIAHVYGEARARRTISCWKRRRRRDRLRERDWFRNCGSPPSWAVVTEGRKRWVIDRRPMHFRGQPVRPWAILYAVEFEQVEHVTCRPSRRSRTMDDPAFYVYGVGRHGCRQAKRVARRLRHDPTAVDRLPPSRVPDGDGRPPGLDWWVQMM